MNNPKKGIDVSEHQGEINWRVVKNAGIDFAIIRIGWTHHQGGLTLDRRFKQNMSGAKNAGVPVGVYAYAYDLSPQAAVISAQKVCSILNQYQLKYPVYYDQEYEKCLTVLPRQIRTDICRAFLSTLESAGYYAALYASKDWLENWVYDAQLIRYDKWVAQYAQSCGYSGDHGIWQYGILGDKGIIGKDFTVWGSIPGIQTNCDANICYKNYPQIIKNAKLNGWSSIWPIPINSRPACASDKGECCLTQAQNKVHSSGEI